MDSDNSPLKVILVGDSFSGKTSLLEKYIYGSNNKYICTTISPDFKIKMVGNTKLQIWDLPGLERFRTLAASYLKLADVAVILFDVTDHKSFENAEAWLTELDKINLAHDKIYLVANKIDLNQRVVSRQEAELFANQYRLKYMECSLKYTETLNNLFENISREKIEIPGASNMR